MLSINTVHVACCECGCDRLTATEATEHALLTTCPECGNREAHQQLSNPEIKRTYERLLEQENPEEFARLKKWNEVLRSRRHAACQAAAA